MVIVGKERSNAQFAGLKAMNIDQLDLQRKKQTQKIILSQNVLVEVKL